MPKPKRYRVINYHIAGRNIEVAGLARPNPQNPEAVVAYLNKHQFHTLISLEDPNENINLKTVIPNTPGMNYIEGYAVADFQPPSIEAQEGIYKIVRDNALKGQKTAIHCAAGLGRTGSILAGLKLKELILAMSSKELSAPLAIPENPSIQLGKYAKKYKKDSTWPCTPLVKQAIEMIRSQGGSYNQNYVENEDQVDQLCEYQTYLIKTILEQRELLDKACQQGDIHAIQSQIKAGAIPTQEQFVSAYSKGNIEVMNALIAGGIIPTTKMCAEANPPENITVQRFLELTILVGELETKLCEMSQCPMSDQLKLMEQELNGIITAAKNYCKAWSNDTMPSETQLEEVIKNATTNLAIHRGSVRTTPVLREAAIATQVIINGLSLILKKISKWMINDKSPVYQEGLKAVFRQPDTDTMSKVKSLKDKIQSLKSSPGIISSQESEDKPPENKP